MEEKVKSIVQFAIDTLGKEDNIFMLFDNDSEVACSFKGKEEDIAKALFNVLIGPDKKTANSVFVIIANIVLKLMANNTKMGKELLKSIDEMAHESCYN